MIRPDKEPRDPPTLTWPVWATSLCGALLIVAIGCMTTYLALRFDALRPQVGDIIVFVPAADPDSWQLRVDNSSISGRDRAAGPCLFDPREMAASGGSVIIEARQETSPPRFQLHWAGLHTAKGGGDCGGSVDFTLERHDLQRLANAAGGFGVKPTAIR